MGKMQSLMLYFIAAACHFSLTRNDMFLSDLKEGKRRTTKSLLFERFFALASYLFIYSSSPFFFIVLIVKVVCAIGFGLNQRIEEILFSLYLTAFPRIPFLVRFFYV